VAGEKEYLEAVLRVKVIWIQECFGFATCRRGGTKNEDWFQNKFDFTEGGKSQLVNMEALGSRSQKSNRGCSSGEDADGIANVEKMD